MHLLAAMKGRDPHTHASMNVVSVSGFMRERLRLQIFTFKLARMFFKLSRKCYKLVISKACFHESYMFYWHIALLSIMIHTFSVANALFLNFLSRIDAFYSWIIIMFSFIEYFQAWSEQLPIFKNFTTFTQFFKFSGFPTFPSYFLRNLSNFCSMYHAPLAPMYGPLHEEHEFFPSSCYI